MRNHNQIMKGFLSASEKFAAGGDAGFAEIAFADYDMPVIINVKPEDQLDMRSRRRRLTRG